MRWVAVPVITEAPDLCSADLPRPGSGAMGQLFHKRSGIGVKNGQGAVKFCKARELLLFDLKP
jgi:hypothetical protein